MFFFEKTSTKLPTPVSALLHSATMVTAGIFLLLRMSSYIHNSSIYIVLFLLIIGLVTSISSGIFAVFKYDIKKIIAFSTCSQLGLLVCGVAFGLVTSTFYHLFIHAFFKALLFLSSGVIIHALVDEQDIRKYGNTVSFASFFIILNCIGTLNIIGFPYMSGFYSKENLILYPFILNSNILKSAILISSIITVIYSIRLVAKCVGYDTLTFRNFINNLHTPDVYITSSVFLLGFVSIFFGYLFNDSISGLSVNTFLNSYNYHYLMLDMELLTYTVFYLILFITVYIVFLYLLIHFWTSNFTIFSFLFFTSYYHYCVQEFLIPMMLWSFVRIYNYIAYDFVLKCVEKGLLESIGIVGLSNICLDLYNRLFYKQINSIFYYVFSLLIFLILLAIIIIFTDLMILQLVLVLFLLHCLYK